MATKAFVTTQDQLDHASRLETVSFIIFSMLVTLLMGYYVFTDNSPSVYGGEQINSSTTSRPIMKASTREVMSDENVAFVIEHADGTVYAGYINPDAQ